MGKGSWFILKMKLSRVIARVKMLEIVEVGNFNYLFNFVHHLEAGIIFVRVEQSCDYFLIIITF